MKCFNWKVIAALGAVGVALWGVAPGLAAGALPLLVLAACPLSMILMMRAMGSMSSCDRDPAADNSPDEVAKLRAEVAALRVERESGHKMGRGR